MIVNKYPGWLMWTKMDAGDGCGRIIAQDTFDRVKKLII